MIPSCSFAGDSFFKLHGMLYASDPNGLIYLLEKTYTKAMHRRGGNEYHKPVMKPFESK